MQPYGAPSAAVTLAASTLFFGANRVGAAASPHIYSASRIGARLTAQADFLSAPGFWAGASSAGRQDECANRSQGLAGAAASPAKQPHPPFIAKAGPWWYTCEALTNTTTYFAGDDPFADTKLGHALTRAIVDTIHEPFLVLDADLRIIVASRSFYHKFQSRKEDTQGRLLHEIGNGQYNAPALRHFLKNIIPDHAILSEYKITHDFPDIGRRTVLLSAREVIYESSSRKHMLLSIGDISGQELLDEERDKLYKQKDLMLKEMKHRMANSLQLIASILILKSDAVESAEARTHLKDTHQRIMSIANVERFLDTTSLNEEVELGPYLTDLSHSLGKSIAPVSRDHPVEVKVRSQGGMVVSGEAISMGLITAELVINALKYAFPERGGEIVVSYAKDDKGWELKISDNGVGIAPDPTRKEGLGTTIVRSLARQLHAAVETKTGPEGTAVSVICRADSPVASVMRGSSTN